MMGITLSTPEPMSDHSEIWQMGQGVNSLVDSYFKSNPTKLSIVERVVK